MTLGKRQLRLLAGIAVYIGFAAPMFAADVYVEALLPNMAVLQIDGQRVHLRAGQSHGPVTLVEADGSSALVRLDGVEQRLTVSQRISGQFAEPTQRSITIRRDNQLQYLANAEINGVRLPVIVDTGANVVALNGRHASRVGIDPDEGTPSQVQTAGSVVPARSVVLDSVIVGGIRVDTVAATVIDGDFPETILLGMSYLKHVEMTEQGGVMTLKARW